MNVQTISSKLLEWLSQRGYAEKSIKQYRHTLSKMTQFYIASGTNEYAPSITAMFLEETHNAYERGELSRCVFRNRRKCAVWLDEYHTCGRFSWSVIPPLERTLFALNPHYDEILKEFKTFWGNKGAWCKEALQTQCALVRQFLEYLQTARITSIQEINTAVITDYLEYSKLRHPKSLYEVAAAIRYLGDFLKGVQIDAPDLRLIVPSVPSQRTIKPSFTDEEVKKILAAVDRSSQTGKRDYAILLLSAKLGIRAVDVARLTLTDFDRNKPEPDLRFTQHKTDHEIILPIETDVGNAIADYILNARPDANTKSLFVTMRAPYRELQSSAVQSCTTRYMIKAGIECGLGKGTHSFRRHLATKMLNAEISYERICEGLGHNQPHSLMSYIRSDSIGLSECALGFKEICAVSGVLG